jgi:hypothetical protein
MALAAIDCVRRGLRNARANWELIAVQWLSGWILLVLGVAGLVPVFLVLGLTAADFPARPEEWESWWTEIGARLAEASSGLAAAGLAAILVWTLGFLVFCFFQAGTYGVLYAGDRQAPAGVPAERQWFRTYSRRDFSGWGGRHLWRFFWFINLYASLLLLACLALALLVGAAVWAGREWGAPAGIGLGCGGSLPLIFAVVVLVVWFVLAQADLPREEGGVGAASRRGWRVLGRRLGGVLLIVFLMVLASSAIAILFAPFSVLINFLFSDRMLPFLAVRGLLLAAESLFSSAIGVALAASLIALVRSEAENRAA